MDAIISVASKVVEYVVSSFTSQIGYIRFYKRNRETLETKVQELEDTKTSVQHSVAEAERNGREIEDIVQNWLKKANDTVVEAKKLVGIENMGHCPNLRTRRQLSRSFKQMTREISKVIENSQFHRISYPPAFDVTIPPSGRGYEALGSRKVMLNAIKEALKDPEMYMIGVHGMGGVGKTTLVNELVWQLKEDGSFGAVVIATVTHSPDVKKIQDQIADVLLNRKLEKESERGRAAELSQRIRQQKSILIILDDIWRELDLTEVGIPFGDEHNGCKLVMTSRDLNVLKKMGTQEEFDLKVLQEEESWNLFKKMAGDVVKEFNIKPIAQKVAKCCVGLPILIVTVAKGLRRKDVTAWKDALTQLERFKHEELQNKVHPAVELSYNCLENDELKSLFLFIGSFGDEIHTGDLFSFCWGLGFYDHMETLTKARNRNFKLINDLRASSLLLEAVDDQEWARMHDVVLDVAKSIASRFHPTYGVKSYTELKEWPNVDKLRKCHYIFINNSYIGELPEMLECPELKLLLLSHVGDDHVEVPDNFFSSTREVRTLDLTQMMLTPSLPTSLHLLINLRSLTLCRCKLGDMRIVAKFKNLEILNLEYSTIEDLPKEIVHLTRLRLLNLTSCSSLRAIPTNLLSSLTCLEELYMGGCDNIQWEVEGSKSESNNASFGELRNLHQLSTLDVSIKDTMVLPMDLQFFAKLERCNILIGDMWEWSLRWSSGAREISRTVKLTNSWWTRVPLTSIEELSFAELKGVEDLLYELDEEGFPHLKRLHIQDSDELLHIINSTELVNPHSPFPNLETLVLLRLNRMEEICHGPLLPRSFTKLKVIKVEGCDRLKNLFLYSHLRNLSQLQEMEISNCEDMKEIVANENHENEKEHLQIVLPELHSLKLERLTMLWSFYFPRTINKGNPSIQSIPLTLFNQQVVMPKLDTLKFCGINTCKIWDDKLPVLLCFQNLIHLEVNGCDSLTNLFPSWVRRALVKLQHLEIGNCSMLKEVFVQQEEVQFPNLETLEIKDMSDLKSIWPNKVAPNSFCKLRNIIIQNCDNLDYVLPISVAKELRQVQYLRIRNCSTKNVVEESDGCDVTFVYIEKLYVWECDNIKTIVPSAVIFQSLDELYVDKCNGVVNIITPSTTTCLPKLRILSICSCKELEEIYGSRNEGDAPLALGEIAFMKLEQLELRQLARLTSFCHGNYSFKFRSLQMVHFDQCPMMDTFCHGNFTTPRLTKVQYGWDDKEEDHWDGDLNTTITTIFTQKNSQHELSSSSKSKEEVSEGKEGEGEEEEEEEDQEKGEEGKEEEDQEEGEEAEHQEEEELSSSS